MRNMSFMLTPEQILDRSKTVTRRTGWKNLKAGELVRACKKCMGLKKGEKIEELAIIKIVDVRREKLSLMIKNIIYGFSECVKEGFGNHPEYSYPSGFIVMFCLSHKILDPETIVTRIEFDYA